MFGAGDSVKTKKSCCSSSPRCKKCPVVWRRLRRAGIAQRVSKRRYVVEKRVGKQELKRMRRN